MTADFIEADREYRKGFASFVWRAYPLVRVGRGGALAWGDQSGRYRLETYADEEEFPFLAVEPPASVRQSQGALGFIHQCFGVAGELIAALTLVVVIAAVGVAPIKLETPRPAQTPLVDPSPVPPADPNAATIPKPSGSPSLINPNAPSAKADAQAQVATAQTGGDVAQGQVLSAAMLQIQKLLGPYGNACSGGAHGVPPANWTALQAYGNRALNALNEAKLALAKGQTSSAVQQISSAQGDLDALVNGLRKSCAGGDSGQDPIGYNEVASSSALLKKSLDELKRSLGG